MSCAVASMLCAVLYMVNVSCKHTQTLCTENDILVSAWLVAVGNNVLFIQKYDVVYVILKLMCIQITIILYLNVNL